MASEYKEPPFEIGEVEEPEFPHPQLDPEMFCQSCGEREYIGRCVCGRKMCSRCIETKAGFCGICDPEEHIEEVEEDE